MKKGISLNDATETNKKSKHSFKQSWDSFSFWFNSWKYPATKSEEWKNDGKCETMKTPFNPLGSLAVACSIVFLDTDVNWNDAVFLLRTHTHPIKYTLRVTIVNFDTASECKIVLPFFYCRCQTVAVSLSSCNTKFANEQNFISHFSFHMFFQTIFEIFFKSHSI